VIVGRQTAVKGGRLDLLALDPQGRWVLIEIKSGAVSRETIAQALDYASCVATMPYEELTRKVDAYLQQTAGGTTLRALLEERQAHNFGLPISVVSYQAFEMEGEQRILARQLTDFEIRPRAVDRPRRMSVDDVCSLAERSGIGQDFQILFEAAQRHGLYPRPFAKSIMYAPPSNRTCALHTVWAQPEAHGALTVYVETPAFAEFFPVSEKTASETLGPAGWRSMTTEDVAAHGTSLGQLFESMEQ